MRVGYNCLEFMILGDNVPGDMTLGDDDQGDVMLGDMTQGDDVPWDWQDSCIPVYWSVGTTDEDSSVTSSDSV